MEQFSEVIEREETRLGEIVQEMRDTLARDEEDRRGKDRELADLKRQKLDAPGWREKREIDEAIDRCRQRYAMRSYQDSGILGQPYFGILELEDDDLGSLGYCIGRRSFIDEKSRALVIDWREAPVSRLYYEYEAGELYEEDIRGHERSGLVKRKRQVETARATLSKIVEKDLFLVRDQDGGWSRANELPGTVTLKEEKADHRLPEITSLISRDQFRAITRPDASTVLLQGGAGSGKTTVGLHRISYLAYQDPERFKPSRILAVMFNRSLQQYISKALQELGVGSGVNVETYHGWARKIFRSARVRTSYASDSPSARTARFKKHPVILNLVNLYLEKLLAKSRTWILEQLERNDDQAFDQVRELLAPLSRFADFARILDAHPLFSEGQDPGSAFRSRLRERLMERFEAHETDLHAMLTDLPLMEEVLNGSGFAIEPGVLEEVIDRQAKVKSSNQMDFADTGTLLWLMQQKGIRCALPRYAHIMADEAQDLSETELATLLAAADESQSITICGDMAQKIKEDVSFTGGEGFAGFIAAQQRLSGTKKVCADTLVVGYRATRPIMELAWNVLGEKPSMVVPRDGAPVTVLSARNHEESIEEARRFVGAYMEARPRALVAIVCRYKADADRVFNDLKACGLPEVRRHERDDFSFQPGVVVTNVHQVKGLEFSAVLLFNPAASQYRDDRENRMLFHVAVTRAADRLWIVGHQPMAYGLEERREASAITGGDVTE